jgi:hypothetical protein
MRKVLLVGLLFAFSSFVSAEQHVSQAPAVAPPVHPAPMVAAPHAPPMAHAPAVAHAPVASHPSVSHVPTQYHSGAHVAASNARATVPPHHTVLTSSYPHRPSRTYGQNGYLGNNLFANNSFFSQCSGAPGLGFDYTHFFATHPNCNNTIFGGLVLPFFGGGGFYTPFPYYDNSQAQPQQQQNEANNTQSKEQSGESSETADAQEAHYFTPPVSDYVFVKRDGTKIFAVAYSLTKDKLQYVTKEGLRRTVSLDSLDYEATEKSNEERGNIINLPRPLTSNIA